MFGFSTNFAERLVAALYVSGTSSKSQTGPLEPWDDKADLTEATSDALPAPLAPQCFTEFCAAASSGAVRCSGLVRPKFENYYNSGVQGC